MRLDPEANAYHVLPADERDRHNTNTPAGCDCKPRREPVIDAGTGATVGWIISHDHYTERAAS